MLKSKSLMKKSTLILLIACFFVSLTAFTQNDDLDKKAKILFEKSYGQISHAEKIEIFKLTGFELADNGMQFYIPNTTGEEVTPFNVQIFPLDLNVDGVEEIGLVFGIMKTTGRPGTSSMLFIKDDAGNYKAHLGIPGSLTFINLGSFIFPDIVIGRPGYGYPVYRWDGSSYIQHKTLTSAKLRKLNLTNISKASYQYTSGLVRE